MNPVMQECDNPYARWWYNGLLWGMLIGVAASTGVVLIADWAGWWFV